MNSVDGRDPGISVHNKQYRFYGSKDMVAVSSFPEGPEAALEVA
jgi:hypothetical protein